ncbi:hypothetical protein [Lacrimispora sp.]|uniref:hypothetical protein n=1 Tax=Lacrimispora sp. TaxID=2719234 RepID=UPI0028B0DBF3|nr:hypothetical protein [Lacrimispora sp.]
MSIRTLSAIKEAEELSISMVEEAKHEAERQVDFIRKEEEQKQQEKLDRTLFRKQEIMEEAKKTADMRCADLDNENQYLADKYENPDEGKVRKAVTLIVERVLKYGS